MSSDLFSQQSPQASEADQQNWRPDTWRVRTGSKLRPFSLGASAYSSGAPSWRLVSTHSRSTRAYRTVPPIWR